MKFFRTWILNAIFRRIDEATDAQIEAIARRIDARVDIPWIGDQQEASIIRGGVRAAVALVRELVAELDRRGI